MASQPGPSPRRRSDRSSPSVSQDPVSQTTGQITMTSTVPLPRSHRHDGRLITAALVLVIVVTQLIGATAVHAEGETINGTLESVADDVRDPVEGVRITVEQDGASIGETTSAADGVWQIAVPEAGIYQVSLDTSTLPAGVAPTDPDRMVLPEVDVRAGQNKTIRFNLLVSLTVFRRAS